MCQGRQRSISPDHRLSTNRRPSNDNAEVVEYLRGQLAETEARLQRIRAREAELSRRLQEMKRFLSVMEILDSYIKRRFQEQRETVLRVLSSVPTRSELPNR
ncbi:hypothetical protein SLE2022_296860 [Rubroshorea leprosula]